MYTIGTYKIGRIDKMHILNNRYDGLVLGY